MKQFEVTFSVYKNAAGTIGVANLSPGKTVVSAPHDGAARSMVQAQFASYPMVLISSVQELR